MITTFRMRRLRLVPSQAAAALGLILLTGCGAADGSGEQQPKNVVIFLVDTLRADHLGCYGYERDTSPRIDAFAEEGLLFENCIAQSTWTKPASASVLTGLYPSMHGMLSESDVLPQEVQNIAGLLKDTPIATAAFAGNQYVFRPQGEMLRDFDLTKAFTSKKAPSYARAQRLVTAALLWIQERGDEPFLAYIHTVDPHAPYGGTEPFATQFIEPGASEVDGRHILDSTKEELSNIPEADRQRVIDLYDGDVAYTDQQFGRFLDGLTKLGRDEDTMVILVADHGEEFYEHGGWQHNPFMHPEVLKVPLIVRLPEGAREGLQGRRADLAAQVDVIPTVLDYLGMWPQQGLQGRSLLRQPGDGHMPPVFSEIEGGTSLKALVSSDYKYVRQWAPAQRESLFDLRSDPDERNDLAESEPELLAEHRARMDAFLAQAASGYSLLFQNAGQEWVSVDCELSSDQPFERVKLIYADTKARHGERRDGPPELESQGGEHLARVRLHVRPMDGDGLSFVLGPGAQGVRVKLTVDGVPVETKYVRMGPEEQPPAAHPLELSMAEIARWSAPRPQARPRFKDEPYRVLLWSNMRAESKQVAITEEERDALEAIGYAGEDDE